MERVKKYRIWLLVLGVLLLCATIGLYTGAGIGCVTRPTMPTPIVYQGKIIPITPVSVPYTSLICASKEGK
jgi:hypothetical protein